MIELFGEMPHDLLHLGKNSNRWFTSEGVLFFNPSIHCSLFALINSSLMMIGNMRLNTTYYPISLRSVLERHIEKSDVVGTDTFLNTLLNLRPENRARPRDIIDHQWFSE